MSIASLSGVLKIFGGSEPTPDEKAELAKEVMLMTLARATSADTIRRRRATSRTAAHS